MISTLYYGSSIQLYIQVLMKEWLGYISVLATLSTKLKPLSEESDAVSSCTATSESDHSFVLWNNIQYDNFILCYHDIQYIHRACMKPVLLIVMIVLLPFYSLLSVYYSTFYNTYLLLVSSTYKEGDDIVCWCFLVCYLIIIGVDFIIENNIMSIMNYCLNNNSDNNDSLLERWHPRYKEVFSRTLGANGGNGYKIVS